MARIEQYFSGQRVINLINLKLTCINESGPVLLIPNLHVSIALKRSNL